MGKRSAPENSEEPKEKRPKEEDNFLTSDFPSDTEAALSFLKKKLDKTRGTLPPVYFVHQIYAIVKNKTKVDREVVRLLDPLKETNSLTNYSCFSGRFAVEK